MLSISAAVCRSDLIVHSVCSKGNGSSLAACRLYQDQLRQRVSANSLKPVNFTDESQHLIAQIEKLTTSA